jgi:TRAP-type uncharacterized transport system substrate-binding protein
MRTIAGLAFCIALTIFTTDVVAQRAGSPKGNESLEADSLNANTVTVITAPIGGPMSIMGSDMAAVLDDGDKLRVLPILGKGSTQNLLDILRLKNIDMGMVTSDALEFAKSEYHMPDVAKRVRYIAPLFHNSVHIVAPQNIKTLQDLNGKRVFAERSIGLPAASLIFRRMGITADIDSQTDPDGGLQKLLNGERDAWVASVSSNAPVIKTIKNEGGKFHLLEIPYVETLRDIYLPTSFSSQEYPNLVPSGTTIDTVAAPTVLMVYNWPPDSDRYRRVARFVDALFSKIERLQQPPRNPKWKDTMISASVLGLERFKPAQEWIDRYWTHAPTRPIGDADAPRIDPAERTIGRNDSPQESTRLFKDFLRWRDGQSRTPSP